MRRVILMLDVTEEEAEQIVEVLDSASLFYSDKGVGIGQALKDIRTSAPPDNKGFTLGFRSRESGALGGKMSAITMIDGDPSSPVP